MVSRVVAVLVVLAVQIPAARADSPKLAEARRAVDEVRFDDARRLLVEAVAEGGNSPAALAQIYELSASTAIVLGQRDLAEQYYRRWLALDPAAKLPDGSSPKLQEALVAAQAFMAAHGRLAVKAERRSSTEIDVIAESDPLAMVASAALDVPTAAPSPFGADHRLHLATATAATAWVYVLDEHGNHVADVAIAAAAAPVDPKDRDPILPPHTDVPERSFAHRWTTWAVPSVAFLTAGGVLGIIALNQQDQLDQSLAKSGQHFFPDVDGDRKSIRRNATIGIALGSVGLVLGIPATIFYIQDRRPWTIGPLALGAVPTPNGFAVAGTF